MFRGMSPQSRLKMAHIEAKVFPKEISVIVMPSQELDSI